MMTKLLSVGELNGLDQLHDLLRGLTGVVPGDDPLELVADVVELTDAGLLLYGGSQDLLSDSQLPFHLP